MDPTVTLEGMSPTTSPSHWSPSTQQRLRELEAYPPGWNDEPDSYPPTAQAIRATKALLETLRGAEAGTPLLSATPSGGVALYWFEPSSQLSVQVEACAQGRYYARRPAAASSAPASVLSLTAAAELVRDAHTTHTLLGRAGASDGC